MKFTPLVFAGALASSGLYAVTIDTIVVTATPDDSSEVMVTSDTRVSEAQGATTVTSEDIRDKQASSLEEALEGNPSVEVNQQNGTQGSQINIRGLSSANVSVRVEGAPNDMANIMHYDSGDRDTVWLNMDMYRSITVVPGAAANVYGTGSTGGVVLLETKDPDDVMDDGRDWGADLRYTHETNGSSNKLSADLAKKFGDKFSMNTTISGLDADAYKDGNDVEADNGSTGTKDIDYLIKGVYTPDDVQRLEVSVLSNSQDYSSFDDSDAETKIKARDKTVSAEYKFNPKDNDLVDTRLRISHKVVNRYTQDDGESDWGKTGGVITNYVELENSSKLHQGDRVMHSVRYGVDYTDDDVTMTYTNDDGSNERSDRTQIGLYATDTAFIGDALQITGSLRYDRYDTSRDGTDLDGKDAFSPKLSTKWMPFENTSAHGLGFTALIGAGYRAPTIYEIYGKGSGVFNAVDTGGGVYTQADGTTTDTAGCITGHGTVCTQANESLKGETSVDSEIGVTYDRHDLFATHDTFSAKVNYFYNDIDDRITSETVGTYGSYSVTEYVNVNQAKVYGWEGVVDYDAPFIFANLSLQETTGYGYEDGVRSKLEDVVPRTVTVKVGTYYNGQKGKVGVSSKWQKGREIDDTVYSSFHTYNLFTTYHMTKKLTLQASVDNITNEVYSKDSLNVTDGVDATVYEAGRNYKLTVGYKF